MVQAVRAWFGRHFSDPQVLGLAGVLVGLTVVVYFTGSMLAPVLASIVIAYLLEGFVRHLQRFYLPRFIAVLIVFSGFIAALAYSLIWLLPLLSAQAIALARRVPELVKRGEALILTLPDRYPSLFTRVQVEDMILAIRFEVVAYGEKVVGMSLSSATNVLTFAVFLVLMPLLVFFFLKDKARIIGWFQAYLPSKRQLLADVWKDIDLQIGNYIRGKVLEIVIVGLVSYLVFVTLELQFALLLGVLVGLSVIIPYIGATVVTVPVAIIAFSQWGFSSEFWILISAYFVIHGLDGFVLVPVMFSEVVNLHPIAIIVAILVFGGLWGFWGVFFAIPLATVVQAVLTAWPTGPTQSEPV